MKPRHIVLAAVAIALSAAFLASRSARRRPPERQVPAFAELEQQLDHPDPKVRTRAVRAIATFRNRDRVDTRQTIRMLKDPAEPPTVRSAAAMGLARMKVWDAMPALIDAMEDPDVYVRGQAGAAVKKMIQRDYCFRAAGPPEERRRIVQKIRTLWARMEEGLRKARARGEEDPT